MQKQAKLTSKGQITVPREVRRLLGVRAGDRLLFESDGKAVRVTTSLSFIDSRMDLPRGQYRRGDRAEGLQ